MILELGESEHVLNPFPYKKASTSISRDINCTSTNINHAAKEYRTLQSKLQDLQDKIDAGNVMMEEGISSSMKKYNEKNDLIYESLNCLNPHEITIKNGFTKTQSKIV